MWRKRACRRGAAPRSANRFPVSKPGWVSAARRRDCRAHVSGAQRRKLPAIAGDAAVIINVDLPAGFHLNPTAPQRYTVSIEHGGEPLKSAPINVNKTAKGLTPPIRVPIGLGAGPAIARVSFTFVYCREDNTGVCRIKTLQWQAPLEVVNETNTTNEINLRGKVSGD